MEATNKIEEKIYTIKGLQVMLDSDLATFYKVETRVLNQAVKRNNKRFPREFMFQLTQHEWDNLMSYKTTINLISQNVISKTNNLRSQNVTSSSHGGRRTLPYAFTEQGVAMLSAVLKSKTAIEVSIQIIQAFVNMKRFISSNAGIFQRLDNIENKQFIADKKIEQVFKALENKSVTPTQGVFFDGQVFDAYLFVNKIIKQAKESIILIDNYIDESVLILLSKRDENTSATIYTKQICKQLKLDLAKHNAQYPKIEIKELAVSHDRFLLIDNKELYHIGASLKDLGKKWFAFSRMDSFTNDILAKLK